MHSIIKIALMAVLAYVFTPSIAKADISLFEPKLIFDSKRVQTPKPYAGIGFLFSNLAPGKEEGFGGGGFDKGLSQFRNCMILLGLRIDGFWAVELSYGRPYKTISYNSADHLFSADLLVLKGMFFPVSLDMGMFSLEPFVTMGLGYMVDPSSTYASGTKTLSDDFNNTANIVYGAGLQIGFIKYAALRIEVNGMSPLNGKSFGEPYGPVMLTYGLTLSFYPV